MFDQFLGLPVHVLVNHAAIVFVPLTSLAAVVFAVVPRWRWLLRWPTLVAAVVALGSTFVTVQSGEALLELRPGLAEVVEVHEARGELLLWLLVGLLVVTVAAFLTLGGVGGRSAGAIQVAVPRAVRLVIAGLLVVLAVWCLVQVALTGHAGAAAVWG